MDVTKIDKSAYSVKRRGRRRSYLIPPELDGRKECKASYHKFRLTLKRAVMKIAPLGRAIQEYNVARGTFTAEGGGSILPCIRKYEILASSIYGFASTSETLEGHFKALAKTLNAAGATVDETDLAKCQRVSKWFDFLAPTDEKGSRKLKTPWDIATEYELGLAPTGEK